MRGLLFGSALLAAIVVAPAAGTAGLPPPWVELAADGALSVRAVVAPGSPCPALTADGAALAATVRPAAGGGFPIDVCEGRAPAATATLAAGGAALPVLAGSLRRVVVIGDTGCRLKGRVAQDCNDARAWPFALLSQKAAARKPDLVIHVGDYHYRESACPPARSGCAGSPHGDNWAAWQADFFAPAAPLLAAAPWVMVRGNHEECDRAGSGWFRLLDPYPPRAACEDATDPYALHLNRLDLLVFDSAVADDDRAQPDAVAFYAGQLAQLFRAMPPHAWLVTHRPFWALREGIGALATPNLNATLQAAIRGEVPPRLDMILSGHVHDFASYAFGGARPAQLVVGTGGDLTYPAVQPAVPGTIIDGLPLEKAFVLQQFGYFVLEHGEDGWDGTLFDADDRVAATCRLDGRDIACRGR